MLFDQYQPPDLKLTRQAEFTVAEQKKGEQIHDFAYRLEKLGIEAYPQGELSEEARQAMMVTRFCQGQTDRRVGEIVWNRRPATLMDALTAARYALVPMTLSLKSEPPRVQQVLFSRSTSSESVYKPGAYKPPALPVPASACRHCGRPGHATEDCRNRSTSRSNSQERSSQQGTNRSPGRDRSDVICYGCQQQGHYQRDCPNGRARSRTVSQTSSGSSHQLRYNVGSVWAMAYQA